MKDGVKWPFMPYEEYMSRIDKARELLKRHNLDALLLFSPTDWWYYGGWTDAAQMHTDCWRSAMIVKHPAIMTPNQKQLTNAKS